MAESINDLDKTPSGTDGASGLRNLSPKNLSPTQIAKLVGGALGVIVVLEILRRVVLKSVSGSLSFQRWWHFHP